MAAPAHAPTTTPATASSRRTPQVTPLLLLLSATLLAGIGNGIAMVALPWLVLERTGSATAASIVAAASSVPLLFASILSGTVVDRIGRKRTSMLSDLLSGLSVIAIPLVDHSLGLTVWALAILAALGSVFDPAGITARETMLPEAARASGWRIDRVNSLYEAIFNAAYLIGPGVGGLLIALVGASNTLWFTGAGFALSIVAVAGIRLAGASRTLAPTEDGSFWANTKEGLAFVWTDRLLRAIAILNMAIVALYLPIEGVILPAHFTAQGTPRYLGWVLMAMSAGGLVGALAYGQWSDRLGRRAIFVWCTVAMSLVIVGMALLPPIVPLVLLSTVLGLTYGPLGPISNVAMQARTPDRLRGRVIGVMSSLAYAAGPLGYLIAGPLIDRLGLRTAFILLAVLITVVAVAGLLVRALHELDALVLPEETGPEDEDTTIVSTLPNEVAGGLYPSMPLNHPTPHPERHDPAGHRRPSASTAITTKESPSDDRP
ncbi:MAG: MFS transporter [Thermomicrobiales bacterium]